MAYRGIVADRARRCDSPRLRALRAAVLLATFALSLGWTIPVSAQDPPSGSATAATPAAPSVSKPTPVFSSAYRNADPEPGYVVGRVLMARDASPVVGAHVAVLWSWTNMFIEGTPSRCVHAKYTTTDANGHYRVPVYVGQQLDPDIRVFAPGLELEGSPFVVWGPIRTPPESPDGEPLWFLKPRFHLDTPLVKGPFPTEGEARQVMEPGLYVYRGAVPGTSGRNTRWQYYLTTANQDLIPKSVAGPFPSREAANAARGFKNHFMKEVEGDARAVGASIGRVTPYCEVAGASAASLVPYFRAQLEAVSLVRERAASGSKAEQEAAERQVKAMERDYQKLMREYGEAK